MTRKATTTTLDLHPADDAVLDRIAASRLASRSDLIREAIRAYFPEVARAQDQRRKEAADAVWNAAVAEGLTLFPDPAGTTP